MAIYRMEAKVFSREGRGRSVVAAAAYRAGTRLKDEIQEKVFDYARRVKGVVDSAILAPEGAPGWALDSGQLWNHVERSEARKDAQLAREFVLAVPKELSADAQFKLAVDWARNNLVSSGMVAEVSLHHPKDGKNPHVHILATLRKIESDGFNKKKSREWNKVEWLLEKRVSWANAVNASLESAGRTERVDHRSLKDQGIERLPEPKIGIEATAMKRKGAVEDPVRFQIVREIKMLNEVLPFMKSIQRTGEVTQRGLGGVWWQSKQFLTRAQGRTLGAIKGAWQKIVQTTKGLQKDKSGPDIEI